MQVVVISRKKLVESAMVVDKDSVTTILDSVEQWHRDVALALLLEEALRRAPVN